MNKKALMRTKKTVLVIVAVILAIACTVGGTIAWLTAKTNDVVNTFTYGDINITLTETKENPFKIVPGVNIDKDPKVTVTTGSEDCYLFVTVAEENWPGFKEADNVTRKVEYAIADGWTELTYGSNIYYRVVNATDTTREFDVLAGNQVTVSGNLTKGEVNSVTTQPKLTFTAYAVQMAGMENALDAWAQVAPPTTQPTTQPA